MSNGTLSPAQQKLLERLRRGGAAPASAPAARSARREAPATPAPLSFAQQRLWFLEQLLPQTGVYTTPLGLLLTGSLDVAALERCFAELARRHEPLRTTYPLVDGAPIQRVAELDPRAPWLELEDVSGLTPAERHDRAVAWLRAEARRPFDLVAGPMFRARLLRLAATEHLLVVNAHHILCDTWSFGALIGELCALYPAFVRGLPSPLPPLAMRYGDFARAQREQARGPAFERHLAYWKTKLGKSPPVLDLVADRPRAPQQAYAGGLARCRFDAALSAGLVRLGHEEGVTLFMTLLAAFKLLLHRYTRQRDIVVGSPMAGRSQPELEPLFGFFANTVVLRTDVGDDPTFRELLGRVRTTVLEASDHQQVPFELLVNEYQVTRDMSHNPLFQVMFGLQNAPLSPVTQLDDGLVQTVFHHQSTVPYQLPAAGIELDAIELYSGTSKFDLWLSMAGNEQGLAAALEYDSDLFERETAEHLLEHFEVLLRAVVEDPGRRLSQLPILGAAERAQLVGGWNQTAVEFPERERLLHQLFEAQAARTPGATALVFEGEVVSYAAFDARANRLAHRLRELGVGPDSLVGVCAERSIELVVALYAILKAGGAYVPFDASHPPERLGFMLRDANVGVLLIQERLIERVADQRPEGAALVVLERDEHDADPARDRPPATATAPDHLAYLMYTSGSTGQPKGVMISHRAIVNCVLWMQAEYALAPDDRVLLKTPYTFDVSVPELFWPLAFGACLVIARPEGHKDPAYLARIGHEQRITTMTFVPSMLQAFIEDPDVARCRDLRRVFTIGEPLSYALMEQFFEVMAGGPACQLHNLYGPTEATVQVTYWACRRDPDRPVVPIGRPLANTQIYVLDDRLQPVPIGRPGELCIGGVQVARGYLHRPELTAERFPRDPFAPAESGARIYRTGDLARLRADGMIEFLGRLDDQVKIRGFRIELGEIEAALRQQPRVKEAAVIARQEHDRKSLVAYVVPDRDAPEVLAQGQLEHVGNWGAIFDDAYHRSRSARAPSAERDFGGWNSSYTGQPLPDEVMQEWVDATVARIRALAPARVLELGCGTGLFLLRLAPHCEVYDATDISGVAIDALEREVRARGLDHVQLAQRAANELAAAPGGYDLVILNSVIQYFPSVEYLIDVLDQARRALAPGGTIFLGDVRSLPLLELFHTSVELAKAPAARTAEQLRRRIRHAIASERELVIDPALFRELGARVPRLAGLRCERILARRGRDHNELTRFRYDAILRNGPVDESADPARWPEDDAEAGAAMAPEATSIDAIRRALAARPASWVARRVPDARLAGELRAAARIAAAPEAMTAGELREALAAEARGSVDRAVDRAVETAIDPEDVFALGDELGYRVELVARSDAPGSFDVRMHRDGDAPTATAASATTDTAGPPASTDPDAAPSIAHLVTQPLRERLAVALFPIWRAGLRTTLPDYMIPSTFILLDGLPVNLHGKLDRAALPAPAPALPEIEVDYVAPGTPTEQTLAEIWAEVLGLESVGIRNNFFALGGDSIRSIQAISRARRAGLEITVEQLFRNQTIAELAAVVAAPPATAAKLQDDRGEREAVDLPGVEIDDVYPVSPKQAYLIRLREESPAPGLHVVFGVTRAPALDVAALARAYQTLIDRHPALRTSFTRARSGAYVQVVHKRAELPIEQADWRGASPDEIEARLAAYLRAGRERGYELGDVPKMRLALFRTADDQHLTVYSFSYLQADGWSNMVMLGEVGALYAAYATGAPAPALPPVPSPRAYIERVQRQDAAATEAFWRAQLRGVRGRADLVARLGSGGEPAGAATAGTEPAFTKQHRFLDRALTARLTAMARAERITLNTLVHAAWARLLVEYTGEDDVLYGAVVSGRAAELPGVEGMVGLFTNLLPVRPPPPSAFPTVRAWLRALQDRFLEIRGYEHSSLADIEAWAALPAPGRLFDSYIVLENIPMSEAVAQSLDTTSPHSTVQLGIPLRVEVWPGAQVLFALHYHRRHFRDDAIARVLGDLERAMTFLLDGLDHSPCLPLPPTENPA